MALSNREGHHHQSNQEEVQKSVKTSSCSRSPFFSNDIL